RRVEIRSSKIGEDARMSGIVRDLEVAVIAAHEKREAARFIKDVGEIAEQFVLIGVVVDRIAAAGRIFNPNAVMQITGRNVGAEFSGHVPELEARLDCVETSHVDGSFACLEGGSALRVDVDYAGVAKTELRRQRAGDERDVIGETSLEFLAKTRNAF